MKIRDRQGLFEAYERVCKEQYETTSIGGELYNLLTSLDPNAKTKTGARVYDELKMILDELNDIVETAKNSVGGVDQESVLQDLLSKLAMD